MSGAIDLSQLLKGMTPELDDTTSYVFLTVTPSLERKSGGFIKDVIFTESKATFREKEGLTLVLSEEFVQRLLLVPPTASGAPPAELQHYWKSLLQQEGTPRMSCITMCIHSSLSAVGFTAAFSRALTDAGISCNVFAGYFHDHIFVPFAEKMKAMDVLLGLSSHYTG